MDDFFDKIKGKVDRGITTITSKSKYEDIDNFSNIKDCTKENHFVGTELTFTF
jgi:hypothetical protein